MNKPKIKGTTWDRSLRKFFTERGYEVTRLGEEGSNDLGDIMLHAHTDIVIEAKNRTQMNIHSVMEKAVAKAQGIPCVVIWKRTVKKPGNSRALPVGVPVVCMTLETFVNLLNNKDNNND